MYLLSFQDGVEESEEGEKKEGGEKGMQNTTDISSQGKEGGIHFSLSSTPLRLGNEGKKKRKGTA